MYGIALAAALITGDALSFRDDWAGNGRDAAYTNCRRCSQPLNGYQYPSQDTRPATMATSVPAELAAVTVRIFSADGLGSGTVVFANGGRGMVLTCKHVLGDEKHFILDFPGGKRCAATRGMVNSRADLALLEFASDPSTPWCRVAQAQPKMGDVVWNLAYPHGKGLQQKSGNVLGYWESNSRDLLLGFEAVPGDSGSGVFLAKEQALCGVVWGREDSEGTALAVELKDVRRFMKACGLLPVQPTAPPQVPYQTPAPPKVPYRMSAPPQVRYYQTSVPIFRLT